MTARSFPRRGRRANTAIEFALTAPILILLLAGVIDLGQFMYFNDALVTSVSQGARYGSLSSIDDGEDPLGDAKTVTQDAWTATGIDANIDVNTAYVGTSPNQYVRVTGKVAYDSVFGFFGIPDEMQYQHTVFLMYQP